MRRISSCILIVGVVSLNGCTFADFWSNVAGIANGGNGYRADHDINQDSEFRDRYWQQSALAREYNQSLQN
jgi:hypothetical protein